MLMLLDLVVFIALMISLIANLFFLFQIRKLSNAARFTLNSMPTVLNMIIENQHNQHDILSQNLTYVQRKVATLAIAVQEVYMLLLEQKAQVEKSEPPPAPPNNWDHMKSAFSRPVKTDDIIFKAREDK